MGKIVKVELPIRINFGGAWSDTPPFCIKEGGCVCNGSAIINGERPVKVTIEEISEDKIILQNENSILEINEIADLEKEGDIEFNLLKKTLILVKIKHKNFKIKTDTKLIPRGSGLGTSSILILAILQAIYEYENIYISEDELINKVLEVEKMIETGGGWQDQAGAIRSGIKLLTSNPGEKQELKIETIEIPTKAKEELKERFVLVYTGNTRNSGDIVKEIMDRLEYEMSVIKKMGYVDYFLIVWDFINYAKSVKIPVGPGRGSGAGSIAAYAMGITDIDPIKYNLIFERFLNPERISMPDFDIDFCYERRPEVIEYVGRKYGNDHVSQIITFGTMSAKMVIRDVARALDISYAEADKLAKMIPMELHITIKTAMEMNKELKDLYENDEKIKKLLDIAMKLEGLPRHASTHAAGVVITKDPVVSYVPLYVNDNQVSTQYTMTILEELGLLKMDFLGLRTLTVIDDAIKLVKENKNIDVKFDEDMNDPNVYKLWQDGQTVGIFQFESAGMTSFMKELKPDSLEDIIAGVSLYRPRTNGSNPKIY